MKFIFALLAVIFLLGFYLKSHYIAAPSVPAIVQKQTGKPEVTPTKVTVLAENLDTPWALAFLPGGQMLITERKGTVRLFENNSLTPEPVAKLAAVKEIGEGGLLGLTIDPEFSKNNFIYLYYTYNGLGNNTLNRVVRMEYKDQKLINEKILIDNIPGASNHNGGRLKFGPDKMLYVTTGDAQQPSRAQDKNSPSGKILRITKDGKPAPGNPFNNLVYSYGHRNSQGLAWNDNGNLYATEHGRSGLQSGLDEINLIKPGNNYGWPVIEGDKQKTGMETPLFNSGNVTWAPSGAAYLNGTLYFAGLKGSALYKYNPKTGKIEEFLKNEFGRLRDVVVGPDGMLYLTTSNLDGRGTPKQNDDKIIKINPDLL